jgi:hypothetical protein
MAAGYAFGSIMVLPAPERTKRCWQVGIAATLIFLVVGVWQVWSVPAGDDPSPALFRLLGQRKYPASAMFLMMTLGPTIALIPAAERARGRIADGLVVFGRVPMFYYLLHIPVIHVAAMVVSVVRTGGVSSWLFGNHPWMPGPAPEGYQWSLPLLYLVFAVVIGLLYLPCRWFARVKAGRKGGWLSYL